MQCSKFILGGLGSSYKLIFTEAIYDNIAWRENIWLMVLCHSLAQRGNGPHNQCFSLSRIDNRGSCLDNMPTFKPKHLLHSCPAGEATMSHSNTLTTLHWQLVVEEKWPGTSMVQNPPHVPPWKPQEEDLIRV